MKLSFLIYSYFPYGGQQRDFLRIVNECLSRGHEIDIYTLRWQGEVPNKVNLILVPVKAMSRTRLYRRFTDWVKQALAEQPVNLVIGFNKMPLLDIYFAADPCFAEKAVTQRGSYYRFTPRYKHFLNYEASIFGTDSATDVLVLSPQQRNAFLKYYPDCGERLHEVPPGIDRDRKFLDRDAASRTELRQEFGIKEDEILILQIGSGFKIKGVDRSLEAIAALPSSLAESCHFMLIGQDKPARYNRLARKLGVDHRFSVLPGRDDIPRFLSAADLLLHPAYVESAGYVLLEATIAGLPVLTTANCGYSFHIEQAQSGEVCGNPFRQEELNSRLSSMLERLDSATWSQNGQAYGREKELYSLPEVATDLIEQFGSQKVRG